MKNYKLSIIIPTKNRQFYCSKAIDQIISNTGETVQIVIQDNSDDPSYLEKFVKDKNQDRIKYHHNSKVLSFVDNFSEAVDFSDGEYICMIGDDDGVLPYIENVTDYAKNNDVDCIIPSLNCVYVWPSKDPIVKNGQNGYLCISNVKNCFKPVNPKQNLSKLLKNGFLNYQQFNVPRLYHGIVSRKVIDVVKSITGHYFDGLTPDMYMVVALSLVCQNVYCFGAPLTISGICPQSGSSASATGAHTGLLKDAPHFVGHKNYQWNDLVPPVYTVETIWAETGLFALLDMEKESMVCEFGKKRLLVYLLSKYPQFKKEFLDYSKKNNLHCIFEKFKQRVSVAFRFFLKVIKRVFRKKNTVLKFFDVPDIESANKIALKRINSDIYSLH